jgi:hypothetical protein
MRNIDMASIEWYMEHKYDLVVVRRNEMRFHSLYNVMRNFDAMCNPPPPAKESKKGKKKTEDDAKETIKE